MESPPAGDQVESAQGGKQDAANPFPAPGESENHQEVEVVIQSFKFTAE